ncbi:uncharacterized protein BX664DRAFT_303113 [Halteromyces radiatus]|uniref:uncharacterized protein n=1 Tax=Halteromyces radiatus TaxID=101107 RepID=UPI00221E8476|nr:uncharacterized protein BX664DRAFT_303113 [Halteromyces radiatus]KAI8079963.1 hypothetical protein BX664DRAFT_303113 [Halteromyces radiatus]
MTLAELRLRAAVDKSQTTNYGVKRWISSVNRLYEEGDIALRLGNIENAYVHYMKGCSIMLDIIQHHPDYASTQNDPFYIKLRKRTNNEIFTILEDIGEQLQSQYDKQKRRDQQESLSSPDDNKENQDDDIDLQRTLDKYPAISSSGLSALDNLPPVPVHTPSAKNFNNASSTIPNDVSDNLKTDSTSSLSSQFAKLQVTPNSTHQSSKGEKALSESPSVINDRENINNTSYSNPIQLPPRTNNVFPQMPQVEPRELAKWITRKDNPASILLLDVRPRDMFRHACIKHRWMVQIEPLVLRKDVSSHKIQDSLVLNPEAEQQLFEQRNRFDLVVFYDQNSPSITQMNLPLTYLKNAIYDLEFTKKLNRAPMLLAGGFDSWVASIGPRGVYCFDNKDEASKQQQQSQLGYQGNTSHLQGHRLMNANMGRIDGHSYHEKTEVSPVNHTLYDYFNQKQRVGHLQSMSQSNQMAYYSYQPSSSIQQSYPYTYSNSIPMPAPMPNPYYSQNTTTPENEIANFSSRYPDIRPNTSTMPETGLQRRHTFIDNPFHGFTATSNKLYDIPPVPAKPTRPLPPPPSPSSIATTSHVSPPTLRPSSAGPTSSTVTGMPGPNLPPKIPITSNNNNPHASIATNTRIAPVSDSSFSQLGGVLIGTTGLKNLGNTCYMNSIIQCLSGTVPFARYFISGLFKNDINKQNPLGTGGVLAESFAELIRVMWSENYNFISPVTFREALVRFAPQYSGSEQQDSQEFLNFLLDGIHEDLNAIRTPSRSNCMDDPAEEARFELLPDYQASTLAWEKYLARNASIIVSLFQGQYRSRLTCLSCKTTSTTYNAFMSLSLPIPSKRTKLSNSVSLYQCLDYFVKEEILEKADAWHCPKCKKLRKASKTLTLSRLPDVLLIHLKRFSFDGPFRNKLETNVDFPTKNLDLSRYFPKSMIPQDCAPPTLNYDLYAVSNHYGSLTGGHYTACVRNGYRGEWHNFDDTRFSVCDESKVKVY